MVDCGPAPVRPRVVLPDASEALLLVDEVRARIEDRRWGIIELVGPAGAGKSVALDHLARCFHDELRLHLADRPDAAESRVLAVSPAGRLVVCASPEFVDSPAALECWRLAAWSEDEWIEYLLAMHRDQCASVMRRVRANGQRHRVNGTPGLWRLVLDRLAADETIADVDAALLSELDARLSPATRRLARLCAFAVLVNSADVAESVRQLVESGPLESEAQLLRLLWSERVTLLLAGEHLAEQLRGDGAGAILRTQLPEALIRETAALARSDEMLLARLCRLVAGRDLGCHAMAASLLHAANAGWIPAKGRAPVLSGAQLAGARWPGLRLSKLNINDADLTDADLSETKLNGVCADGARMSGATLHGALLKRCRATRAVLGDADLSFIRAQEANFRQADLRGANLEGSLLAYAKFERADLRDAKFCRARLVNAFFRQSVLDGADFSGADLSWADLEGLALRCADFSGAKLRRARLVNCDMEFMSLPGVDFTYAVLRGAHLTGSQMPAAKFRKADLAFARLAEIEWPHADLRDADLHGATFHMGSSRSGLVGSPIASEGSRTGFYTDEYFEQDFKAPEEIRKANLYGADLRGANIDKVDFYLVDLRGARYTRDQEEQLRSSGAILESRV